MPVRTLLFFDPGARRKAVAKALQDAGFTVVMVGSALWGSMAADGVRFDAAVLCSEPDADINLLAKNLKRAHPWLPVLQLCHEPTSFMSPGVDAMVYPATAQQLMPVLEALIAEQEVAEVCTP
jgi:hypothetical protein